MQKPVAFIMAKKKKDISVQKQATLRDGSFIAIGDEVSTNYHSSCVGQVFIVAEINDCEVCESKSMIVVHLKDFPDRRIEGFKKEGWVKPFPDGLDANWFKKC